MNKIRKLFYILTLQKCKAYGHNWRFAYNYGIPLHCSDELYLKLKNENKTFAVHKCKRCGVYDHESDHLLS